MKLIDLFSGAGGLSCGLEQAGFHPILANEIVPEYANTYKLNHPQTDVIIDDIRNLTDTSLIDKILHNDQPIDLIAGGPPCQGFSINAPIRTLDDPRNHLFKDYLRMVAAIKPRAVLIENVPGIVSLGKGTVVEQIYAELDSLGYKADHRILFAGHYGVPQMRFRTVIIALKKENPNQITFPEPRYNATARANFAGSKELCIEILPLMQGELKDFIAVGQALTDLPEIKHGNLQEDISYSTDPQNEYQEYLRAGSQSLYNHYCSKLGQINQDRLKHIPQGGSWRDIPVDLLPAGLKRARRSDHTKRYGRLDPNGLCSTVLTKCDPHWGSFFHPYQDRVISVREAARIQSFPDRYHFYGSMTQQYEQVGNAVPPLLAKAIGEKIKELLKE